MLPDEVAPVLALPHKMFLVVCGPVHGWIVVFGVVSFRQVLEVSRSKALFLTDTCVCLIAEILRLSLVVLHHSLEGFGLVASLCFYERVERSSSVGGESFAESGHFVQLRCFFLFVLVVADADLFTGWGFQLF